MTRLLSILLYALPGAVALLFTLYLGFHPKGYDLAVEVVGLLLVVGMALVAAIAMVRRTASGSKKRRAFLLVLTGPILLFLAVPSWLYASKVMHFSFEVTTTIFAALLIVGMATIAYSIYLWLANSR